jgi:acyl-CoA reductase-like NAD-dependent aldehyde dehydrogenase
MQPHGNLITGEWVVTGNTFDDINPSDTSDIIGTYSTAGEAEVIAAIAAAKAAFKSWPYSTPQQRFDVLDNAGTEILARKAELGALLSREGKTLPEGIGEVTRAGHIFKYFAGEALRAHGEVLDSVRPGVKVEITREPVGVIALICPWNFPIAIPAWKIAPAIAFGNTVVCNCRVDAGLRVGARTQLAFASDGISEYIHAFVLSADCKAVVEVLSGELQSLRNGERGSDCRYQKGAGHVARADRWLDAVERCVLPSTSQAALQFW